MEPITERLDKAAALCRQYGLPADELDRTAARLRDYRVRVAVLGAFNAGKSALVNALAGAYVTRVSLCEQTLAPLELCYGTGGVQVERDGGATRGDTSLLRQSGDALAGAELVRAALPLEPLRELPGVTLLDTPGIGTRQAAANPRLPALVRGAAGYLLVAGADAPVVTESMMATLSGLPLDEKPVLAVLTKCDQFSPADVQAIAGYLRASLHSQLGLRDVPVCCVRRGQAADLEPVRDFLRGLQVRSAALREQEGERGLQRGAEGLLCYLRERLDNSRLVGPALERKADALHERLNRLNDAVETLNTRVRDLCAEAVDAAAQHSRVKLQPLAQPLAEMAATGQDPAVYADGALRTLLLAEARSRLGPVLTAYQKSLVRLAGLYAPDAPAAAPPDVEACVEAVFPGTAAALGPCAPEEGAVLDALQALLRTCLQDAARDALEQGRRELAAPLYEQLASLQKALEDARREQHTATEARRRTEAELQADLDCLTALTEHPQKEGTGHVV